MIVYNHDEITPDKFYELHVQKNIPCVIKNFLSDSKCSADTFLNYINNNKLIEYNIANISAAFMSKKNICDNIFINSLANNPNIINNDIFRVWKHNKNNLTPWHYDGNGADLLNISLKGSKRFYLAKPDSLPVYPLSNVAYHYDFAEDYYADIYPNDMLYIPAYWFHKVLTLEENTVNINYIFFNKLNHNIGSSRNVEIILLHKLFNTSLCETELICDILDYEKNPKYRIISRGIYEMFPVYLLILLILFMIPFNKEFIYFLITISLYLIFNKSINDDTFHYTYMLGTYLLIFCFIILSFYKNNI